MKCSICDKKLFIVPYTVIGDYSLCKVCDDKIHKRNKNKIVEDFIKTQENKQRRGCTK